MVIAAAILSFGAANAQIAAYLGYQSVTTKAKVGDVTTSEPYSGFLVGGAMNFDVYEGIGIQPALELNYYGKTKNQTTLSSFGAKIPIDVNYGFDLAPDFKLYAFAGPSIYIGILNKTKYDSYDPVADKTTKVTRDNYENNLKRFGLGFGLGAWCDFKDMIRLKVAYDMGLNDRSQNSNVKFKENTFSISVGYLF